MAVPSAPRISKRPPSSWALLRTPQRAHYKEIGKPCFLVPNPADFIEQYLARKSNLPKASFKWWAMLRTLNKFYFVSNAHACKAYKVLDSTDLPDSEHRRDRR